MQKFSYDRVFSHDGQEGARPPRPRRTYKADEVETIRAEAQAAGEHSALVKTEQLAAQSINVVAAQIETVINSLRAELDVIRDDSTRLAAKIARKFVEHMIDRAPELYLERCIEECLEVVHREPQVVITISATAPPSFRQHLVQMAEARRFGPSLRIEEDAKVKGVACRLGWHSGGADIALEDALLRMEQIIEDHISALAGTQAPQQATA